MGRDRAHAHAWIQRRDSSGTNEELGRWRRARGVNTGPAPRPDPWVDRAREPTTSGQARCARRPLPIGRVDSVGMQLITGSRGSRHHAAGRRSVRVERTRREVEHRLASRDPDTRVGPAAVKWRRWDRRWKRDGEERRRHSLAAERRDAGTERSRRHRRRTSCRRAAPVVRGRGLLHARAAARRQLGGSDGVPLSRHRGRDAPGLLLLRAHEPGEQRGTHRRRRLDAPVDGPLDPLLLGVAAAVRPAFLGAPAAAGASFAGKAFGGIASRGRTRKPEMEKQALDHSRRRKHSDRRPEKRHDRRSDDQHAPSGTEMSPTQDAPNIQHDRRRRKEPNHQDRVKRTTLRPAAAGPPNRGRARSAASIRFRPRMISAPDAPAPFGLGGGLRSPNARGDPANAGASSVCIQRHTVHRTSARAALERPSAQTTSVSGSSMNSLRLARYCAAIAPSITR